MKVTRYKIQNIGEQYWSVDDLTLGMTISSFFESKEEAKKWLINHIEKLKRERLSTEYYDEDGVLIKPGSRTAADKI